MADEHTSPTSGQEPTADATNPQGAATPQAGKFEAAAVTPQAGNSGARTPSAQSDHRDSQASTTGAKSSSVPATLEEAIEALRQRDEIIGKERAEAARYRKRAQELDAREKQEADAKLSESERLQQQLAERDAKIAQAEARVILIETRSVARELGLKPEAAMKLIDQSAIAFDEQGVPTNIAELITQALQELGLAPAAAAQSAQRPAATSSSPATTNGAARVPTQSRGAVNPGTGASQGSFTHEQLREMARNPRAYAANRDAILRQLAAERNRSSGGSNSNNR